MLFVKRPRSVACAVLSACLSGHVLIHYRLLKRDGKNNYKVTSEILRAAVTVTIVIICNIM